MSDRHFIAVIGGACAGSEITAHMIEAGHEVVVFEQNTLPYGKIEDGLPRWHAKLRDRESRLIDEKLDSPRVHFLPTTAMGKDVQLRELIDDWGFSLVVLATGAWKDRPIPVEGLEGIDDVSFVYQNDFLHWYNRHMDADYDGLTYDVSPGAVVVGGGLASIDVAKICQFENVMKAMRQRGHEVDLEDLEKRGVHKVLARLDLTLADLNIKPARIYYRRRVCDMPLVPMADHPDPKAIERAKSVREKIVRNATTRYGFEVHPMRVATKIISEGGSVTGIEFKTTVFENGRLKVTDECETVQTQLIVSSIGSIPQPMKGVPMDGELYRTSDQVTGQLIDVPGVFCVGNAITGKGNIRESVKNAKSLSSLLKGGFSGSESDYEALIQEQRTNARQYVKAMLDYLGDLDLPNDNRAQRLLDKVKARQADLGLRGSYMDWRQSVLDRRAN